MNLLVDICSNWKINEKKHLKSFGNETYEIDLALNVFKFSTLAIILRLWKS
ncbi:hypothetical protein M2263_003877 [Providencia alcalifaciens]|nr:hypothetical protein [Providencia alcalifaciens]